MSELQVINQNGQLLVDSREVADMIGKRHDHLMADIRKYVEILDSQDFGSQQFFIPSVYRNSQNKEQPCFHLTRKGCDMVANKMTGEKGVLFTAAYVTKFEEMEKQLHSSMQELSPQLQFLIKLELDQKRLEQKVDNISEIVALNSTDWRKDTTNILNKIALKTGGYEQYRNIRNESYELLEQRANAKLNIRVMNKQKKMALEGAAKSKIDKVSKLDVIEEDKRLLEIYLAVVKEMAIKYQVEYSQSGNEVTTRETIR